MKNIKTNGIQNEIFKTMSILVTIFIIIITTVSILIEVRTDTQNIDNNLINVAGTLASSDYVISEITTDSHDNPKDDSNLEYLHNLEIALTNVDVISVVSVEGQRCYHSNSELISTTYDGTIPDFSNNTIYVTSDVGPSGSQRRAYAAVHDNNGDYIGFVLVVLLNQHIAKIIAKTIAIHLLITILMIGICLILSRQLSTSIKNKLHGFEPDAFSAMFSVRDSILESLEEGVIAINTQNELQFINSTARKILKIDSKTIPTISDCNGIMPNYIHTVLDTNESILGANAHADNGINALVNYYPIIENGMTLGVLIILVDRTEYARMAENLTGVNYLVDSMRANNHDFTNKLHVILGLIQMEKYSEACGYISEVTMSKQVQLSNIMRKIEVPAIAALLIGKQSRAAELNIDFSLEPGSTMKNDSCDIPTGDLITIIGNLIENSMDAMDKANSEIKELSVGIYSEKGNLLIKVSDSGPGIPEDLMENLFEKGVTTKGEGRGIGLYVINNLVRKFGGTITVDSEHSEGTSFSIWFK